MSESKKTVYRKTQEAIARLTPQQFRVTQENATERPGTGELLHNKQPGIYVDIVSGEPLFASSDKFESGCGWPSFTRPVNGVVIEEHLDTTHGMVRTEIVCHHCDAHLGHVFDDGPQPTGLRYCVNSSSLELKTQEKNDEGNYP